MKRAILLLLGLALVVGIYQFVQQRGEPIENFNTGVEHINREDYAGAIPYLEKAHEQLPNEMRISEALSLAYERAGETAKAERFNKKLKGR